MDWNMKTSSVMVYVCVLKGQEAIPFSLEKKDRIYLTGMPAWKRNWGVIVIARSARAGFVVTTVIVGTG